jgi:hypothetical protein
VIPTALEIAAIYPDRAIQTPAAARGFVFKAQHAEPAAAGFYY